jgi:hypothetical protein
MKVNAIECLKCGDIIYSRARWDFLWCSCKNVSVDGGFDYCKVSFATNEYKHIQIELDVTEKDLYDDWNKRADKHGRIKKDAK